MRYLSALDKALMIQGTLTYKASGKITKMTVKPYKGEVTILEREVVIENDERSDKQNLKSLPPIKGAVEGLLKTIDGDLEALQRNYK